MAKVQVFLLTHNRPNFVQKAVESVLAQNYDDFEFILSDNSTNDDTRELFKDFHHPKFKYIKRKSVGSFEHVWGHIFKEVRSPYFMMFHDDDELCPDYLKEVMAFGEGNPDVAAVGVNAYMIMGDRYTQETCLKNPDKVRFFSEKKDFISKYLTPGLTAPYPGYIYNSKVLNCTQLARSYGGKYSDMVFIAESMNLGKVAWLGKPLMRYRFHANQDSASPNIRDRLSMLRYIYKETSIKRRSPEAMSFRCGVWCDWLKYSYKKTLKRHQKRYFKILRIMLPYLLKNKFKQIGKILSFKRVKNGI